MNRRDHWNAIYGAMGEPDVSWFEAFPAVSLELLDAAGLTAYTCVIDIGGGQSRLVDALLERGLNCVAVLDVSSQAIQHAQERLGSAARRVTWIEADVTGPWSVRPMDIWHDRAVFHFLTVAEDRARYLDRMRKTLTPHGSVIIATFALDGPETCSGLPVARYSPETLADELGGDFELQEMRPHKHVTPLGAIQSLQYSRFRRVR